MYIPLCNLCGRVCRDVPLRPTSCTRFLPAYLLASDCVRDIMSAVMEPTATLHTLKRLARAPLPVPTSVSRTGDDASDSEDGMDSVAGTAGDGAVDEAKMLLWQTAQSALHRLEKFV